MDLFINIIFSILIWSCVLVCIFRVLNTSGISFRKNGILGYMLSDRQPLDNQNVTLREMGNIFLLAMIFRIMVFFISYLTLVLFQDANVTLANCFPLFEKWDAANYIRIATGGYRYHIENGTDYTTLAFFPLYPFLMWIFSLGNDQVLHEVGLLVSYLSYSIGCAFLYKTIALDYGKKTAATMVILISVFPHSLFFGSIMNESMLLMTSAITLYFIRTHNWLGVGIAGAFAAMSRMVGVLLIVPAAIEFIEYYQLFDKLKNKEFKKIGHLIVTKGFFILITFVGIGVYLLCNYTTTGDWFKFLEYQKRYWANGSCYFGKGIGIIIQQLLSDNNSLRASLELWIPEITSITFVAATIIYSLRNCRNMYTGYLIIYFIINTGFDWPISVGRYMTCAIPAFIATAIFAQRHPKIRGFLIIGMSMLFSIYLILYFAGRQIL